MRVTPGSIAQISAVVRASRELLMLRRSNKHPNPYVMAIFTAILAAGFATLGTYYTHQKQTQKFLLEQRLGSRKQAYTLFLEKIDREKSPLLSRLLHLGSVAEHLATDGEIQTLEDAFEQITVALQSYDLYWQLSNDMSILRMYGSRTVVEYANDLLDLTSGKYWQISLQKYPRDVQVYFHKWKKHAALGVAYGWKERITSDERLTLILTARLFRNILETIRAEFENDSSDVGVFKDQTSNSTI